MQVPLSLFSAFLLLSVLCRTTKCFQGHSKRPLIATMTRRHDGFSSCVLREQNTSRFLFGRNKEDDPTAEKDEKQKEVQADAAKEEEDKLVVPFFGRFMGSNRPATPATTPDSVKVDGSRSTSVAPTTGSVATLVKEEETRVERKEETPESLRAKAERVRLEAERMDAELTLSKIDKLAKQLSKAKAKGDSVEDLQRQLDALQAKLRGENVVKPPATQSTPLSTSADARSTTSESSSEQTSSAGSLSSTTAAPAPSSSSSSTSTANGLTDESILTTARSQIMTDQEDITLQGLNQFPGFMVKVFATLVEMEVGDDANDIDKEELVNRWNMVKNQDFSFSKRPPPQFSQAEINETIEKLRKDSVDAEGSGISERARKLAAGNETQLALYSLETNYYLQKNIEENLLEDIDKFLPEFLQNMLNTSALDATIVRYYPACTRKEGEDPTEAQVDALVKTVLPAVKFSSNAKPEKVPGGYIICGTHKYGKGDDLIDAIDKELAKSGTLADKMTVLYSPAFPVTTIADGLDGEEFFEEMMAATMEERDPVLYVTGTDVTRDSNRLGLTITSIIGIATSWYLSIYPFLLNDQIGRRVDEELALVDGGLQPDLTWLTDLSMPLFLTFMGLQLVHELAHRVVAATKGVKLSIPVFVPSLITGVTSTVTTFKTLPKNKEDMFDISAVGPLAGIVASALTLALGAKLTLVSDPSMLPALPLEILRQSTLGGAIVDNIIQGSLYVPEGAPTNGIMISLHPVAIAGYMSLVVNALGLLPIGSKLHVVCRV